MRPDLLLTCEHGGHRYPKELKSIFQNRNKVLRSHRGWDEGALPIAKLLSKSLRSPLIFSETSRLVMDLNRSSSHPKSYSEFTRDLPDNMKDWILRSHYLPFRNKAEQWVRSRKNVLHLSIHSFVPVLNGEVRNCDIGLLYDPARSSEKRLALRMKKRVQEELPGIHIRMNYPYKGNSDGFTTHLRKTHSASRYQGLEVEFNQAWIKKQKTPAAYYAFARVIHTLLIEA